MENETKMGMNRTGMQMSPIDGPNQVDYAMSRPADPPQGGSDAIAMFRSHYIQEASRVGSMPPPATGRGVVETAKSMLTGNSPEVLLDKLGERAAYERTGVRLYEALINKVNASDQPERANMLADLQHIMNEEFQHFQMLTEVIVGLGADPTVQTPCADVSGVQALGFLQVLTDPRTTVTQGLQAILAIELLDHASWELLIELAEGAGQEKLGPQFREALQAEAEHTVMIRKWLRQCLMQEAT